MSSLLTLKSLIIPEDWRLIPIGTILLDSQYGTNAPTVKSGSISIVGMKDIQDGKILTGNLTKTELPDSEKNKFLLKKGDLLINRTNSYDLVGKVGIYDSDEKAIFASYLVRLILIKDQVIPKYLNYWLNSHKAQVTIKRIATRAVSQANINPTEFKKYCLVPLPPLPEQTAIADLLSTWDAAIEKTEKLIAAKEKRFAWLVQRLISNRIGKWKHLKAKDMFKSISEKKNGDCELLSVTQDRGVIPRSMLEGRVMSPQGSTDSYKLIKKGDFAISLRSFQGGIEYSEYQGIISPAYTVLRPIVEVHDEFYRHFFKSRLFVDKYLGIAVIGIRDGKQVSIPDFMTVKIPFPSLGEQKAIATALNTAQQELSLLRSLVTTYRKQKRGLMQKLLTGRWRVKVAGVPVND